MTPEPSAAIVAVAAWIGAMLERLDRGAAPLSGFEEAVVCADRGRFGVVLRHPIPDFHETWAPPGPSVADGLGGLLTRLHERTRGAVWEEELWFWLLQFLPGGLPDAIAHDLIDREIAIDALGHCNLGDGALWRLADRVDEALLRLAKRRYVSEQYTADAFEEVLHAFPQHEWTLMSLPSLPASDREKVERLAAYIRRHPRREELVRHACEEFLEVWGRVEKESAQ